jgi:hypothetical protein
MSKQHGAPLRLVPWSRVSEHQVDRKLITADG